MDRYNYGGSSAWSNDARLSRAMLQTELLGAIEKDLLSEEAVAEAGKRYELADTINETDSRRAAAPSATATFSISSASSAAPRRPSSPPRGDHYDYFAAKLLPKNNSPTNQNVRHVPGSDTVKSNERNTPLALSASVDPCSSYGSAINMKSNVSSGNIHVRNPNPCSSEKTSLRVSSPPWVTEQRHEPASPSFHLNPSIENPNSVLHFHLR